MISEPPTAEPSIALWIPLLAAAIGAAIGGGTAMLAAFLSNRAQDKRQGRKRRLDFLATRVHAYGKAYALARESAELYQRAGLAGQVVLRELNEGKLTPEEAKESRMTIADTFHASKETDESLAAHFKENLHLFEPDELQAITTMIYSIAARKQEMQSADSGIRSRYPLHIAIELQMDPGGLDLLDKLGARFIELQKEWARLSSE